MPSAHSSGRSLLQAICWFQSFAEVEPVFSYPPETPNRLLRARNTRLGAAARLGLPWEAQFESAFPIACSAAGDDAWLHRRDKCPATGVFFR
jgi:hypothetical protein